MIKIRFLHQKHAIPKTPNTAVLYLYFLEQFGGLCSNVMLCIFDRYSSKVMIMAKAFNVFTLREYLPIHLVLYCRGVYREEDTILQ